MEGWSWFYLVLVLDIALKFYNSIVKVLRLKVRKFWRLIPMVGEVAGENLFALSLFATFPPIITIYFQ